MKYLMSLLCVSVLGSIFAREEPGWERGVIHSSFVENKGQFEPVLDMEVLYKLNLQSYNVYFMAEGFVYEYLPANQRLESELEELEHGGQVKVNYQFVRFAEAEKCEVFATNPDGVRHCFRQNLNLGLSTVWAEGMYSITYKNIYDNVDFIFSIPLEGGLKYDIVLNPGAVIEDIVLDYEGANSIEYLNEDKHSILINANDFILNASIPGSQSLETGADVNVTYALDGNQISFKSAQYNSEEGLLIDPWEIVPGGSTVSVFDVDYDYDGNVYSYGGDFAMGYYVVKYDPAGTEEWMFDVSYMGGIFNGDIAVNKYTGDCYVISVVADGATDFLKLNTDGDVLAEYGNPDAEVLEIWRCEYDHCNDSLIIGVGGDAFYGQINTLDGDLTGPLNARKPVTDVVGCIDVSTMTIDPEGESVYVVFPDESACAGAGVFDNRTCKLPLADLETFDWEEDSEYSYLEVLEWSYSGMNTNNNNGICVGYNLVFTTDGNKLVKRSKETGLYSGETFTGGTTLITHGIAADLCDNVFVGVDEEVHVYDSSLTLLASYPLPGSCNDVQLNKESGMLYVVGENFVKEIDVTDITNVFTLSSTPDLCEACDGSASVESSCSDIDIYDIAWYPGAMTTSEITDLCAGYYTCYITYGCDTLFSDSVLVEPIDDCGLNVSLNSDTICEGDCIDLIAEATLGTEPYTYEWSPGILEVGDSVNVCPEETTTYQVIVTDALGEKDTTETTITVLPYPIINLGSDTTLCVGDTLVLDAENPGAIYLWQDGSSEQTFTVLSEGVYWVQVDNGGCSIIDSIIVTYVGPEVDLGPDTVLCEIEDYTLDAGNPGTVYLWQDSSVDQFFVVVDTGEYYVTVTDPASGCFSTDTILVQAGTLEVNLGNDTIICFPETLLLDAENPGAVYLWSDASTAQTLSVNSTGVYSVEVNRGFCVGSDSIMVTVQNPEAVFTADDFEGCAPESVDFTDLSDVPEGIASWFWDFDDGGNSALQNPSHTFISSGTYEVSLAITTTDGCVSDTTQSIEILIHPNPEAAFTYSPKEPFLNELVLFEDLSTDAASWFWEFGDGASSFEQHPNHYYEERGSYTITLIVQNEICYDTAQATIIVDEPVIFYVPNVFTPDGDLFNEIFQPVFSSGFDPYDFHLTIFNRWGEIIFESYDHSKGWDGTYGDQGLVQDGVYVWVITFGDINSDKKYTYSGHVSLLK